MFTQTNFWWAVFTRTSKAAICSPVTSLAIAAFKNGISAEYKEEKSSVKIFKGGEQVNLLFQAAEK